MPALYDSTSTYDVASVSYDGGDVANFGLPTVGVFIAFNDSPYVAEPGWEDVTQYVRLIPSIRRARSDDWSAFTGSASVVLSNRDQRFNPFNTASPYNGKLKPRRQIKIVAVSGENSYTLFRGYIAGWPVDWSEQGLDSTVTIECFDALALLAAESSKNLADSYIKSLSPRHYYPCNDPINQLSYTTQTIKDYGSAGNNLTPTPYISSFRTANAEQLADGLYSSSINVLDNNASSSWLYESSAISATDGTFSMWAVFRTTQYAFFYGGLSYDVQLSIATNYIGVIISSNSNNYSYTGTIYLDLNQPHHVVVGVTSAYGLSFCYVDGVQVTMTLNATIPDTRTVKERVDLCVGTKQQVAVFTRLLTTSEIQTIYSLGIGVAQESTAARFNRVIAATSFPAVLTSAPSAPEGIVSEVSMQDTSVITMLELVRNSEGGELYTSKDGVVTLTNRNSQLKGRSAATQASFKDDGTGLKYADNFSLDYDADSIVNDLRLTITGGAEIIGTDSASQALVGRKSQSLNTQLSTVADAQTLADTKVAIFGDPIPTVSPLQVGKTRKQADWQTLLSLEVLDQIEVTRTPTSGSVFSDRLLINEISHSISPDDWDMTITGSARYSEWFTIDTDFIDGDRLIA